MAFVKNTYTKVNEIETVSKYATAYNLVPKASTGGATQQLSMNELAAQIAHTGMLADQNSLISAFANLAGGVAGLDNREAPALPAEPASAATYDKASGNFGTMRHVEPIRDHLINANFTIEKLRLFAAEKKGSEAALLQRVDDYLHEKLGNTAYTAFINDLGILPSSSGLQSSYLAFDPALNGNPLVSEALKLAARFFHAVVPKIGESSNILVSKIAENQTATDNSWPTSVTVKHNTHSALFGAGRVIADDIRTIEALRNELLKARRAQQSLLEKLEARLVELDERIFQERLAYDGLEARRSEALDDYVVAQRLLAEHWKEIEAKYAERKRIIESNVGLYYVKVRETPLSRTLPDPLDLRFGSSSDLVPGCSNLAVPLKQELHPFMETVLDVPASDWAVLSKLADHLPGRTQLEQMVMVRRQRIDIRVKTPSKTTLTHPTLNALLFNHIGLVQTIAARPFVFGALRDMQQQSHRILALEDMLASPIPALRDPAMQLQQRLTAAAGCLLNRLSAIRPSIRLTWSDLADSNRLAVETPEYWPGLDKAEGDDFNNLRTLIELVQWWFRQLDSDASGESRTAMRNFVRACLLLAAGDDPQELLQGQLKTLPAKFRPGEVLRLDLNREPSPGNILQMVDDMQQVVATLRVQDHDDKGTVASITSILKPNISLNLAMRVTGRRG